MLEPGVIQDVLSAGSHLQLLELLSLCSHYLIQVWFSYYIVILFSVVLFMCCSHSCYWIRLYTMFWIIAEGICSHSEHQ